ncbi:hypothetical protein KR054_004905, partial [Drosophila jambulina]
MQTDEPAAANHRPQHQRRMMANCYYANKLRGGYFTERN